MLQYLYKDWARAGSLLALYTTLLIVCMVPHVDFFIVLVWLQFPVYLLHEFEEHAYPGGFKEFVNKNVFHVYDQDIPLTEERVFWINILAVWVLFPLVAVAAQFIDPVWGLLSICFSLVNASLHILMGIGRRMYNPGLLASVFLNYPVGIYALLVAHREGYLLTSYMVGFFLFSVAVHILIVMFALHWYRLGMKK